jgi:biopolymer transport protein ExbD
VTIESGTPSSATRSSI